jgi:hypothetical protein
MHVDNALRAKNLAAKAGDAMLAEFDHGKEFGLAKPIDFGGGLLRFHMNNIGWTNQIADAATCALFQLDIFDHAAKAIILA